MENLNVEFNVPYYILEEIVNYIESGKSLRIWNNVELLINLARMNGKITEEQAKYLKEKYK